MGRRNTLHPAKARPQGSVWPPGQPALASRYARFMGAEIEDVHDCTLTRVILKWEENQVTVRFELEGLPEESRRIVGVDLEELSIEHKLPWGPSNLVNGAEATSTYDGRQQLNIEMQSGDSLRASQLLRNPTV